MRARYIGLISFRDFAVKDILASTRLKKQQMPPPAIGILARAIMSYIIISHYALITEDADAASCARLFLMPFSRAFAYCRVSRLPSAFFSRRCRADFRRGRRKDTRSFHAHFSLAHMTPSEDQLPANADELASMHARLTPMAALYAKSRRFLSYLPSRDAIYFRDQCRQRCRT